MTEQFSRTARILGENTINTLSTKHVTIFGLGGVGGYVAEALVRSGIGKFDLIDHDRIDITNLNRQIIATHKTLMPKSLSIPVFSCRKMRIPSVLKTMTMS